MFVSRGSKTQSLSIPPSRGRTHRNSETATTKTLPHSGFVFECVCRCVYAIHMYAHCTWQSMFCTTAMSALSLSLSCSPFPRVGCRPVSLYSFFPFEAIHHTRNETHRNALSATCLPVRGVGFQPKPIAFPRRHHPTCAATGNSGVVEWRGG